MMGKEMEQKYEAGRNIYASGRVLVEKAGARLPYSTSAEPGMKHRAARLGWVASCPKLASQVKNG